MLNQLAILSVASTVLDPGIPPKLSAHIKEKLMQKQKTKKTATTTVIF